MTGGYTLVRSDRRTLSLEITPDGSVLVRAPRRVPTAEIESFVASHRAWIAEKQVLAAKRHDAEEAAFGSPARCAALRAEALRILPAMTAHFAALMGVSFAGVSVTSAKRRFGSCSSSHHICYSLRLMAYPLLAQEYVVVHELAHIRHPNHGKDFYKEVASILPDYRAREALLRSPPEEHS